MLADLRAYSKKHPQQKPHSTGRLKDFVPAKVCVVGPCSPCGSAASTSEATSDISTSHMAKAHRGSNHFISASAGPRWVSGCMDRWRVPVRPARVLQGAKSTCQWDRLNHVTGSSRPAAANSSNRWTDLILARKCRDTVLARVQELMEKAGDNSVSLRILTTGDQLQYLTLSCCSQCQQAGQARGSVQQFALHQALMT